MYSFDVFDTLITRTTATPKGIFLIIEKHLNTLYEYEDIDEDLKKGFYYLRAEVEGIARNSYCNSTVDEISLAQIYEILGRYRGISKIQLEKIILLEIQTEFNNIIGIPENICRLKKLVDSGEKVVLISDMYLSGKAIRDMLIKIDRVFTHIPLYVSADYGKTKSSGRLYELVAVEENGGSYKEWVHIGDNSEADNLVAASYGIRTEHYNYEKLKPFERKILEKNENSVIIQLLVGNARNSRILYEERANDLNNEIRKQSFDMGSSIGGPMLISYVKWIFMKCKKRGIKRLYFIARDGYILKMIADKLIEIDKLDIETHYFYGSRKALRVFYFDNMNVEEMIKNSTLQLLHSLEDIAHFFEVPIHVIKGVLSEYRRIKDKILTTIVVEEIIKILFEDIEFREYFYKVQEERKNLLIKYMNQEIKVLDSTAAFVELYGSGFTQECLSRICKENYNVVIPTFYLNKFQFNKEEVGIYYVYIPSGGTLKYIIEEFCRAPHGQTMGYFEKDGIITPVLGEDENDLVERYGFDEYIKGILKFVECYSASINHNYNNMIEDELLTYMEYLNYIIKTPDKEVLDYLSDMPFNHTGQDKEENLFAPKLTKRQMKEIFLTRHNEPIEFYYKGSSLEYSLLRCDEEEKLLIDEYKRKNKENNWNRTPNSRPGLDIGWGEGYSYTTEQDLILKNIILFGAGKRGQGLYLQLKEREDYNVIAWVDNHYHKYRDQQFSVQDPLIIQKLEYDQIVIAIANKNVADEIIEFLLSLGVPKKKILWVRTMMI